jgi:hypothetical protein
MGRAIEASVTDRRSFLRECFALAALGVTDPEALLWTPSRSRIVVPEMRVYSIAGAMSGRVLDGWTVNADGLLMVERSFAWRQLAHDFIATAGR